MNVCLGGTFDPLHKGHEALLEKAFDIAGDDGFVFIGLTSATVAKTKGQVHSYSKRKHSLEVTLKRMGLRGRYTIQPLKDKYGPALEGNFDAIVVSPETEPTAQEINRRRSQLGNKPLQIFTIPFVLAQDNRPISSTRIRRKEIDSQGNLVREE